MKECNLLVAVGFIAACAPDSSQKQNQDALVADQKQDVPLSQFSNQALTARSIGDVF